MASLVVSSPELHVLCGGRGDLIRTVNDGSRALAIYPVHADASTQAGLRVGQPSQTPHTVQAVGRREYLDVQTLGGRDENPPHITHHGVVESCVDLIDHDGPMPRLADRQR